MSYPFQINTEIGKLKSVIVKRPGKEVENLTPSTMHGLLFDDLPYLKKIQEEHDAFTNLLTENGAEVLFLEDLTTRALKEGNVKNTFIERIVAESRVENKEHTKELVQYLQSLETRTLVDETMAGIRKDSILGTSSSPYQNTEESSMFLMEPMPSLYYTRDPATVMGKGISINKMTFEARKRESLYMEFILNHHPLFLDEPITRWRERDSQTSIEGGDILVLNPQTLLVGVSERTTFEAVEELAHAVFDKESSFERVVAIEIPHVRAMMHLDTVFTMVDTNAFTIHPGIIKSNGTMPIHVLEKTSTKGSIKTSERTNLLKTLEEMTGESMNLIQCGGGDPIAAPREQWNDGSNTLAIAPGVVVTYDRNHVSNKLLREQGIKVLEIPSGELSRGRGGPRCMSMPLKREI